MRSTTTSADNLDVVDRGAWRLLALIVGYRYLAGGPRYLNLSPKGATVEARGLYADASDWTAVDFEFSTDGTHFWISRALPCAFLDPDEGAPAQGK